MYVGWKPELIDTLLKMETYVDFSVDEVKNLNEDDIEGLVNVLEGDKDFQKEIEEITSNVNICLSSWIA